jgi:hypothetical protein
LRITPTVKQTRKCELCGVYKKNAIFYTLKPHPAIIKLLTNPENRTVCKVCAMREEFGSKYKQSKKYKEWEDAK